MTIVAAADGSALGNPGPAGWAWFVDEGCWAAGGWPHGTNNQGELMAVLDLLRSTADSNEPLQILCDSQYVINTVTKWRHGWKKRGWRKADGKPVLNVELIQQIDAAMNGRAVEFEWVKGHAGHELNEAADERARAVATAYQAGTKPDAGPGFAGRPSSNADVRKTASGQRQPAPEVEPVLDEPDLFSTLDDVDVPSASDEDAVRRLELELLDPQVRTDPVRLAELLHPDFTEIGSSGRLWDRDSIIAQLTGGTAERIDASDIRVERIGTDVVLVTWRSQTEAGAALRSSWWVRENERWRVRFHQGTPEA